MVLCLTVTWLLRLARLRSTHAQNGDTLSDGALRLRQSYGGCGGRTVEMIEGGTPVAITFTTGPHLSFSLFSIMI